MQRWVCFVFMKTATEIFLPSKRIKSEVFCFYLRVYLNVYADKTCLVLLILFGHFNINLGEVIPVYQCFLNNFQHIF